MVVTGVTFQGTALVTNRRFTAPGLTLWAREKSYSLKKLHLSKRCGVSITIQEV
jgi:hypothetical protein